MEFLKSKLLLGMICFVAGIGSLLLYQHFKETHSKPELGLTHRRWNIDPLFDEAFNNRFFQNTHDPFEEMRKMRQQMMKQFEDDELQDGPFDSWFKKRFGGGNVGDIKKHEDEKFIYYDIAMAGVNKENLKIKVGDGQITISGRQEKQSEEGNSSNFMSSTFQRSFPVPPNVDGNKVKIEQEKDKLVLKFPKNEDEAHI